MSDKRGESGAKSKRSKNKSKKSRSNEKVIDNLIKGVTDCCPECEISARNEEERRKISSEIQAVKDDIPDDFEKSDDELSLVNKEDDYIDEDLMKDAELEYTDSDRENLRLEAEALKTLGNEYFKSSEYTKSAESYTSALRTCSLAFSKDRAILYSNRAAAKMKLNLQKSAIDDCTKAVELDPMYLKAYFRRAQLYVETEKLDEALTDYQKILELDPEHREAMEAVHTLPEQIQQRNEQMKDDMLAKLKDLGNMILRPFGLSTNNFQMNPNEDGGYSVNFQQNAS